MSDLKKIYKLPGVISLILVIVMFQAHKLLPNDRTSQGMDEEISNLNPPATLSTTLTFSDITKAAGVKGIKSVEHEDDPPDEVMTFGHGVSFGDFNRDGKYDFIYANAGALAMNDVMYRNNGGNTFTNVAGASGVNDKGHTHAVVNADFDNDGDLDLFYSNQPVYAGDPSGGNRLYRNNGNGSYTEITGSAGISSESSYSRGSVALDFNNDGWLDLFVLNWGSRADNFNKPNEVYRNNGNGTFTRVHNGADGPSNDSVDFGRQGATCADIDNDGDLDIYVCRRGNVNWLYVNDGNGHFSEQAASRGVACDYGVRHHGAVFVDIDNDHDLDLFVMPYGTPGRPLPTMRAFYNNGNGYFNDKTDKYNFDVSGYSLLFGDFDNDADMDMFMLRNSEREPNAKPELYLNNGSGALTHTYMSALEHDVGDVRSGGLGDIDNDGDLDIYMTISRGDRNYLFRNNLSTSNHYLDVLCIGPGGDYGGFGTKVAVFQPNHLGDDNYLLGYQESVSEYSYLCQNQTALHFGLGDNSTCDIQVIFTNGDTLNKQGVSVDRVLTVEPVASLDQPTITDADVHSSTDLVLTWSAVDFATGYNVYRDVNPDFQPDLAGGSNRIATNVSDQDLGTSGIQWADTDDAAGNTEQNYFYKITATRSGEESTASAVFGEFDFFLGTFEKSNFNDISLPFVLDGIDNAQDLLSIIPEFDSVAEWDPTIQDYVQYVPGFEANNFTVRDGYPYYVNVSDDVVLTLTGKPANPVFSLITTAGTDFNEITLPFDKSNLAMASDLLADIANCNSVASWQADIQGYLQYIPGLEFTDFPVRTGYPYYVNVTQDVNWPGNGAGAPVVALRKPGQLVPTRTPHVVWGHIMQEQPKSYRAWLGHLPDQVITSESPGCTMTGERWVVQVGDFSSGWEPGNTLITEFYDGEGNILTRSEQILSDGAFDIAGSSETGAVPDQFMLYQNYPNPFNPETTIRFVLPASGYTELVITDITGRTVKTLVREELLAGEHAVKWNGTNNLGQVASGVYFYTLKYQNKQMRRKLLLVR